VKLYGRKYKLTIDGGTPGQKGVEISDLDVGFKISKSIKKEPNKAEILVYNLSPDTRKRIDSQRDRMGKLSNPVRCDMEAGYDEGTSLIFSGDLHTIFTEKQGSDWVTHLASADGLAAMRQATVAFSVKRGTPIFDVFKKLAKGSGVGIGNALQGFANAQIKDVGSTFPEGTVIEGQAYDELCRLADSAGLEVSVQGQALQVKTKGRALSEKAIELSSDSGLVGSPAVEAVQDPGKKNPSERYVTAECLLIPGIFPGRKVNLDPEDKAFKGTYECVAVDYAGETFGQEWGLKLKLRPV
jgi:hypothetical protein